MNQCHEDKKGENTVIIYRWYNTLLREANEWTNNLIT